MEKMMGSYSHDYATLQKTLFKQTGTRISLRRLDEVSSHVGEACGELKVYIPHLKFIN